MFVIEYAAVNPKPKPNPYNILLKKIRVVDDAVILLNSVFYLYAYSIEKLGVVIFLFCFVLFCFVFIREFVLACE